MILRVIAKCFIPLILIYGFYVMAVVAGGRDRLTVGPRGVVMGDGAGAGVEIKAEERHLTLTNPTSTGWTFYVGEGSGNLYLQHLLEGALDHVALMLEPDGDVAVGGNLKMGLAVLEERHVAALNALLGSGLSCRLSTSVSTPFGSIAADQVITLKAEAKRP